MPISGATPMARRTGDSVTEPAWQAEPVEAATSPSEARISDPARPWKFTLSVFGSRSVGWPLTETRPAKRPRISCSRRSRRARDRRHPELRGSDLAGRTQAGGQQHVLGAGAPPRFVARAVDQRLERAAPGG